MPDKVEMVPDSTGRLHPIVVDVPSQPPPLPPRIELSTIPIHPPVAVVLWSRAIDRLGQLGFAVCATIMALHDKVPGTTALYAAAIVTGGIEVLRQVFGLKLGGTAGAAGAVLLCLALPHAIPIAALSIVAALAGWSRL